MTTFAMRFSRIFSGRSLASHKIFFSRYLFKMNRINAKPVSAEMVDDHSFFYFPIIKLIGIPMSIAIARSLITTRPSKLAIAFAYLGGRPKPAGLGLMNLLPKAVFRSDNCFWWKRQSSPFPRSSRILSLTSFAYAVSRSIRKVFDVFSVKFVSIDAMSFCLIKIRQGRHYSVYKTRNAVCQ